MLWDAVCAVMQAAIATLASWIATSKATAASKVAGMKKQYANYCKAQQHAKQTYYDDAKVTAAPFMVAGKRSKIDAGVASSSINILPPWAALGPSISKKMLPTPARSSSTPPAPSPVPLWNDIKL